MSQFTKHFNNNVIKIRYDLINSENVSAYTSNDIFDSYTDILKISNNQKVNSLTPFDSFKGHRFCYFISDIN